jgi:hypothetical protein
LIQKAKAYEAIKVMCEDSEKFTLDIDKDWEGRDISVMAYIENIGEAGCRTKVLQDSFKGVLIRGVAGEDEAFAGQTMKYEVLNSNKDGDASKVNDGSDVKWAIKVGVDGGMDKKMLEGERGKKIIALEIKKDWAGKEITVMPYLNSPTKTVSVKTNVYISLGSAIKEANKSNTYARIYKHSDLFIRLVL